MKRAISRSEWFTGLVVAGVIGFGSSSTSASSMTLTLRAHITSVCEPSSDEFLCTLATGPASFDITYDPDDLAVTTHPDGSSTIATTGPMTFTTSLPGIGDPWGGTVKHTSSAQARFDAGTGDLSLAISDTDTMRGCLAIGPGCGRGWTTSLFLDASATGLPLGTPTAEDFARLLKARGGHIEFESTAWNIPTRDSDIIWTPGSVLYTAVVPEPGTAVLLIGAMAWRIGRRRRRASL